jgi:hypothetical protein
MRRARVPIVAHFAGFGDRPSFDDILPLARLISDEYEAGTYNQVDIVFTRFVSTLVQRADMVQLLPIKPSDGHARHPRLAVHLRAGSGDRPRRAAAALRRHPALPGRAREHGQLLLQPDGGDEERHRERGRTDRGPDPQLQQGPPGQHHQRD